MNQQQMGFARFRQAGAGGLGLGVIDGLRAGLEPARKAITGGLSTARAGIQSATRAATIQESIQSARRNVRRTITGEEEAEVPTVPVAVTPAPRFQFQTREVVEPATIRPGMAPKTGRIRVDTDL